MPECMQHACALHILCNHALTQFYDAFQIMEEMKMIISKTDKEWKK